MAIQPDNLNVLLARADAAIAEARRLIEANENLQHETASRIHRMLFRASFYPKALKLFSPLDFLEPDRSSQPFPIQSDDA